MNDFIIPANNQNASESVPLANPMMGGGNHQGR